MNENVLPALVLWGRGLVDLVAGQGHPIDVLNEDAGLPEFIMWAQDVTNQIGAFVILPPLSNASSATDALAWARALDTSARDFGQQLPELPEG